MCETLPDHLVRTKVQLVARLRVVALADGLELPVDLDPMRVAETYRAAMDPEPRLVDADPSPTEGIGVARALVIQGSQEVMTQHYRAIRKARQAAATALQSLTEMYEGTQALRTLHQAECPLYSAEPLAELAFVLLPEALARMPQGPSKLANPGEEHEAMVMNMTRQLSLALGASAIAALNDDGGDQDARRRMDRVRRRLDALADWSNGNTEIAHFPPGWQDPRGG